MCLPEREQDAAMDDMGAHLDDKADRMMACCPVNQDLAYRTHRLTDGAFIASDFMPPPMPDIDAELRDGSWPSEMKQAGALVSVLILLLLVTQIPYIDWAHVLGAMWGAR